MPTLEDLQRDALELLDARQDLLPPGVYMFEEIARRTKGILPDLYVSALECSPSRHAQRRNMASGLGVENSSKYDKLKEISMSMEEWFRYNKVEKISISLKEFLKIKNSENDKDDVDEDNGPRP
jgi:hypothetical protein